MSNPTGRPRNTPEKVLANCRPGPNGCIEWAGFLNAYGYGQVTYARKVTAVHRFVYEHLVGPIPKGLQIMHSCDNRKCMNIKHLSVGTQTENAQDAVRKGRYWGQRQTHCKHGHAFTKENIYRTTKGHRRCRACMRIHDKKRTPRKRVTE